MVPPGGGPIARGHTIPNPRYVEGGSIRADVSRLQLALVLSRGRIDLRHPRLGPTLLGGLLVLGGRDLRFDTGDKRPSLLHFQVRFCLRRLIKLLVL